MRFSAACPCPADARAFLGAVVGVCGLHFPGARVAGFSFYGRHVPKLRSLERRFVGMQFPAGRIRGVQAGRRQPFGGTWQHVVFERCKMEFANFTLGKFRGVRFAGGTMRSVGFDECRFERVEFSLCDLTMAEFSRTRLKGLSFVDSDIRGIRVGDTGSFELKGLKVSALQASELARLLGLEIEE